MNTNVEPVSLRVVQALQETAANLHTMSEAERAKTLPKPTGYKLLLILPEQEKAYASGILKSHNTARDDEVASVAAFVAAMGPDAYKDPKFINGPWCAVGDFVVIRPYSGTRIVVHGKEMRLVNDDAIEAVVDDPRGIKRVGG